MSCHAMSHHVMSCPGMGDSRPGCDWRHWPAMPTCKTEKGIFENTPKVVLMDMATSLTADAGEVSGCYLDLLAYILLEFIWLLPDDITAGSLTIGTVIFWNPLHLCVNRCVYYFSAWIFTRPRDCLSCYSAWLQELELTRGTVLLLYLGSV